VLVAKAARADEEVYFVDKETIRDNDARHAIDRTWLYGDDARVPLPGTIVATSSVSYTNMGAEGGARHFLGPIASLQLWHDRVTIVGGPAIGLSSISPDFVARVAASVGF
jgi:hypothetical protein